MDIRPGDHVLDIGCGGGMAIKRMAEIAIDGFVAGVDPSEIMVQQALRCNAATVQARRVTVKPGSISALPYKDESFDRVCAIESFYFWPDPIAGLKEVHRVLRPGGRLVIALEWSKEMRNPKRQVIRLLAAKMGCPLYSGAEMIEILTAAGFSQAQFQFNPGPSWFGAIGLK